MIIHEDLNKSFLSIVTPHQILEYSVIMHPLIIFFLNCYILIIKFIEFTFIEVLIMEITT